MIGGFAIMMGTFLVLHALMHLEGKADNYYMAQSDHLQAFPFWREGCISFIHTAGAVLILV